MKPPTMTRDQAMTLLAGEMARLEMGFTELWMRALDDHRHASLALLSTEPPCGDGSLHGAVATMYAALRPREQMRLDKAWLVLEAFRALTHGWMDASPEVEA